jgi:hypothetical protein
MINFNRGSINIEKEVKNKKSCKLILKLINNEKLTPKEEEFLDIVISEMNFVTVDSDVASKNRNIFSKLSKTTKSD